MGPNIVSELYRLAQCYVRRNTPHTPFVEATLLAAVLGRWRRRLSVALQRGNARMLRACLGHCRMAGTEVSPDEVLAAEGGLAFSPHFPACLSCSFRVVGPFASDSFLRPLEGEGEGEGEGSSRTWHFESSHLARSYFFEPVAHLSAPACLMSEEGWRKKAEEGWTTVERKKENT